MVFSSQNLSQALECAFKFHLLQSSGGLLRIYTHKPSYKPGKVIKSVDKKEKINITFVTKIFANYFQIK